MTGFGKDGRGQIIYENEQATLGAALGAAAAGVAIGDAIGVITEDFRVLRVKGAMGIEGLAEGEMAVVGIADGELSDTEIAACLVSTPTDHNDNAALETSHRPVFPLGYAFGATNDGHALIVIDETLRWTFGNPEAWQWFIFNPGGAHAGAITYTLFAKVYGVWVR